MDDDEVDSILNKITNAYLGKQTSMGTPLLDAMPKLTWGQFKEEIKGTVDEGLDLSEVPVCPRCALEVSNKVEHEEWHMHMNREIVNLQEKVQQLEQMIKNLLSNTTATTIPRGPGWVEPKTYISDEEIRKYSQNPYKHPPKPKYADPWDKHDPF